VFGIGSLLAATCQGVILGKVITGMLPGGLHAGFVAMTAIGVGRAMRCSAPPGLSRRPPVGWKRQHGATR